MRRTAGCAKTVVWFTTCISCRSKRRRNRPAPGTTTRSCRPFQVIKPFVLWTKADAPWSNSDERMCRYVCMKEVMTHAELDDQWSKLFRRRASRYPAAVGDPGGPEADRHQIRLRSRPVRQLQSARRRAGGAFLLDLRRHG